MGQALQEPEVLHLTAGQQVVQVQATVLLQEVRRAHRAAVTAEVLAAAAEVLQEVQVVAADRAIEGNPELIEQSVKTENKQ